MTATIEVGAEVDYPQGRGWLILFRDGTAGNSLSELDSGPLATMFSEVATLKQALPFNVSERVPPAQAAGQAAADVARQGPAPSGTASIEPGVSATAPASGVPPMEPTPPPELDETRLLEMVGVLRAAAFKAPEVTVRRCMTRRRWRLCGCVRIPRRLSICR